MFANAWIAWPRSPAFPKAETKIHSWCPAEIAGDDSVEAAVTLTPATPIFFINSLSGEFFADSAGYANINNLNLNFDVGDAEIVGTISSKLESFDTFNLEMSFNTSLSQNIPWYVAILGGFPAAAGAVVVTEVLEDGINQITETKYGISGSADNLIVETR